MSLSSPPPAAPSVQRPTRKDESASLPGHSGPPRTAQFKTRQEQKAAMTPSPASAPTPSQSSGLIPIGKKPSPYMAAPKAAEACSTSSPPAFGNHASPQSSAPPLPGARQTKAFPSIKGRQRHSFKEKYRSSLEKKTELKQGTATQRSGTGQLSIPENLTASSTSVSNDKKEEAASGGSSFPDMPGLGSRWERSNNMNSSSTPKQAAPPAKSDQTGREEGASVIAEAFRESLARMNTARPILKIPSYTKRPSAQPLSPAQPPQARVSTTKPSLSELSKPNPISSTPSASRLDSNPHGFVDPALPGQIK
jgi:hypothetical protein